MTADELIEALKALPPDVRALPVVCKEEAWLIDVKQPRVTYRNKQGIESDKRGERVVEI